MPIHRDRALLLKRSPFGESSLVAQVLTRANGRVHLLAKGAYRPTSGYYAILDFFDTLELEWSSSKSSELDLLRRGSLETRRRRVSADLPRYRSALAVLELVEFAAQPAAADPELFDLSERALDALAHPELSPPLALVVFELAFLHNLGLAPALDACAACGGAAPALPPDGRRAAFSAGMGGRLCRACAARGRAEGRRVGTLPTDVLESALELRGRSLEPELLAQLAPPSPERLIQTRIFTLRFLAYHLQNLPRTHRLWLQRFHDPAPSPRAG